MDSPLFTFPHPNVCLHNTNNTVAQPVGLKADATVAPSIVWTTFSASPVILLKHSVFNGETLGQTYKVIGPPGTGDSVPGIKCLTPF